MRILTDNRKILTGNRWRNAAVLLGTTVLVATVLVPVPFVVHSPGPVFDVLGEIDGEPVLQINGVRSYPTDGELDMTTVSETGGTAGMMTTGTALVGLFAPHSSVIPEQDRYPDGVPDQEDRDVQEKVFAASQSTALAAAANYLDRPVTTEPMVFDVVTDGPADQLLHAGDIILAVNGDNVSEAGQVGKLIAPLPVGSEIRMRLLRDGERLTVRLTTAAGPEDPGDPGGEQRSIIGIVVQNHYQSDFTAEVALSDIGGPSAGLVFAMAMVDRLRPESLLAGRHVAGTGTIVAAGDVGPIGGIDKKMQAARDAGAGLFLAPAENCPDVVGAIPDGLSVVPVSDLSAAIDVTQDWLADRELPSCADQIDQAETDRVDGYGS